MQNSGNSEPYLCKKLQTKYLHWSKWPFVAQFSRIYSEKKSRRIVHLNQRVVFDRLESIRSACEIVKEIEAMHDKNRYIGANFMLRWKKEQQLKFFHRKVNKNTMDLEDLIIWKKSAQRHACESSRERNRAPHAELKSS